MLTYVYIGSVGPFENVYIKQKWMVNFSLLYSWILVLFYRFFFVRNQNYGKVQRADLTCDVIKKLAPFVLSKFWILVSDWSMCWSHDTFLIKLQLYVFFFTESQFKYRKVPISSLSQLVACFQIFRSLMKGIFDAYVSSKIE